MRKYYLEHGLSINARTSQGAQQDFFWQKRQQVHARLFSEWPVTQRSRLANLRTRPTLQTLRLATVSEAPAI
jgi:hypothetical protein